MNRRGNLLVMMIFFVLAFGLFSKLVFDVARWIYIEKRLQASADAALLSSLRIRVDGLQTVAQRWNAVGRYVVEGYPNGHMLVPASSWILIQREAETLRRALSGYRGRISAVLGVVLEANRIPRESARFVANGAQDLGIVAEAGVLRDEGGHLKTMAGAWYRRRWAPTQVLSHPPEHSVYELELSGPGSLFWRPRIFSRGRVRWDVDRDNSQIQVRGNGGFPAQWLQALDGNRVDPHRFPVFSAGLQ